ncbi:hypothetical protein [Sphingomonas colocasiae]|uniref:Uncharacterized protein n=1 Tax=Sphingomonas colocasiae TaxID=1848973 RepID=A0ABS7PXP1_9SPHN|nr:hypothetical protein [Sphingomonas colocasiae]MBY8826137.1 hypothetical protein [Sphingomonas colocasiae]
MQVATDTWNIVEETARWSYAADMIDEHGEHARCVIMDKVYEGQSKGDRNAVDFWMDIAGRALALVSSAVH